MRNVLVLSLGLLLGVCVGVGSYHQGEALVDSLIARSGSHGHGWGWGHQMHHGYQDQNLDLYSLLGGLSFASLLGATIIYLARRNTSGRRKRSTFGYIDDDVDLSNGLSFSDIITMITNYK